MDFPEELIEQSLNHEVLLQKIRFQEGTSKEILKITPAGAPRKIPEKISLK